VIQDEDEAKRASQDRYERNAIGDGVGHAGDPLLLFITTTGATSTILVELVEWHILQG
jgi:hypothetical protein